jgi:hypothetical protein
MTDVKNMPPAGPRAPGWTGSVQIAGAVPGWGGGGGHPVPAGQDEPSTPPAAGPGRSAVGCSIWTGGVRGAPLRVADGDGMDRPYSGTAAPAETPGIGAQAAREENGKWQKKSLGKSGKTIMVICLE